MIVSHTATRLSALIEEMDLLTTADNDETDTMGAGGEGDDGMDVGGFYDGVFLSVTCA